MLYQKYRPKTFDDVVGNKAVVGALKGMLKHSDTMPHVFVFSGPSGCGKTTLARILARELGCTDDMVLTELNAANTRGIDTIRDVVKDAHVHPWKGKYKLFILDESHQLTSVAQQALLKDTEDVMLYCFFVFCTTEPENLIPTIKNRATCFEVEKLPWKEIYSYLVNVCEYEKVDEKIVPDDLLELIAKTVKGSMRAALVDLEKVIEIKNSKLAYELIKTGTEYDTKVWDLCQVLITNPKERKKEWKLALKILSRLGDDSEKVRKAILWYLAKHLPEMDDGKDALDVARIISVFSQDTFRGGMEQLTGMIVRVMVSEEG